MSTDQKRRLYVLGDPQIGNETQERRTTKKVNALVDEGRLDKSDIVIIPGDLTEHGVGSIDNIFFKYFAYCVCFRDPQSVPKANELAIFRKRILEPLERACDNVFFGIGNHDTYTEKWYGKQAPRQFVQKRYGDAIYMRQVEDILVFCLSLHPTRDSCAWWEYRLDKTSLPFIVFFHYNISGPYSDWWSDEEKQMFLRVLEKHRDRCICIVEGHYHASYEKTWHGFRVVNGSGGEIINIEV